MELTIVQKIVVWALPLLFAITIHEYAHAWVAHRLGDNTAKQLGRLSINPVRHIDLYGTVIVPLILVVLGGFLFGWAKAVPVNTYHFKKPKTDMAWVALAGPASNLMMAFAWGLLFGITYHSGLDQQDNIWGTVGLLLRLMSEAGVFINIMLMVFNLLPIPPLDGSRVITPLLPNDMAYQYNLLEKYGFIILLVLLYFGMFQQILSPWVQFLGLNILQLFW